MIDTAVIGIIGVGVGAIVTGGVQTYSGWRTRKLAARVAARLLAGDLTYARGFGAEALERHDWPAPSLDRHLREWEAQRVPLASALSAADWFTVGGAVSGIQQWIELRDQGVRWNDVDADELVAADLQRIENAMGILVRASKAWYEPSLPEPELDEAESPGTNAAQDTAESP
jgi:hypothetical protein